ncbi:MAG TPA: hypothetical protein PLV25_01755 [Opitutales bacterium]|nr:hypothetical protein [Opitutales bacterium]
MKPNQISTQHSATPPDTAHLQGAHLGNSPAGRAVQTGATPPAYAANLGAAPAQPPPASTSRATPSTESTHRKRSRDEGESSLPAAKRATPPPSPMVAALSPQERSQLYWGNYRQIIKNTPPAPPKAAATSTPAHTHTAISLPTETAISALLPKSPKLSASTDEWLTGLLAPIVAEFSSPSSSQSPATSTTSQYTPTQSASPQEGAYEQALVAESAITMQRPATKSHTISTDEVLKMALHRAKLNAHDAAAKRVKYNDSTPMQSERIIKLFIHRYTPKLPNLAEYEIEALAQTYLAHYTAAYEARLDILKSL